VGASAGTCNFFASALRSLWVAYHNRRWEPWTGLTRWRVDGFLVVEHARYRSSLVAHHDDTLRIYIRDLFSVLEAR
jgi:hypothetical protein